LCDIPADAEPFDLQKELQDTEHTGLPFGWRVGMEFGVLDTLIQNFIW